MVYKQIWNIIVDYIFIILNDRKENGTFLVMQRQKKGQYHFQSYEMIDDKNGKIVLMFQNIW